MPLQVAAAVSLFPSTSSIMTSTTTPVSKKRIFEKINHQDFAMETPSSSLSSSVAADTDPNIDTMMDDEDADVEPLALSDTDMASDDGGGGGAAQQQSPKRSKNCSTGNALPLVSLSCSTHTVIASHTRIKELLHRRSLAVPLRQRRGFDDMAPLTHVPTMRERQYALFAQMRQTFAMGRSHRRRARLFRHRALAIGTSQFHEQRSKLHGSVRHMGLSEMLRGSSSGGKVHYYEHHESDNNDNSTPCRDIITYKARLFEPENVDESIFELALQYLVEQRANEVAVASDVKS